MAKKKTQFNKAKYNKESGILSYNYLGGEAGKGRGAVSIIKQGDDWFFADKNGKIRTDVGINGKLTPTHMQNLENDGIFAAAKINNKGEKLSTAEIKEAKANIGGDRSSGTISRGSGPNPRGDIPTTSGNEINRPGEIEGPAPNLADRQYSNLSLSDTNNAAPAYNPALAAERSGPGNAFTPNQTLGDAGQMRLNTDPNSVPSNFPDRSGMGIGENVYSAPTAPAQSFTANADNMKGPVWGAPSEPKFSTNFPPNNAVVVDPAQGGMGAQSEWADKGFASEPKYYQEGSAGNFQQHTGGSVSPAVDARLEAAAANTTTPGVTDNTDSSWGAADWNAVGSVMKGVGGLASAYTGLQNYRLARDAYNTQKDQWQQDYNQRLKAYEDNKQLANQDIQSRNRTLRARNAARTDTYQELA